MNMIDVLINAHFEITWNKPKKIKNTYKYTFKDAIECSVDPWHSPLSPTSCHQILNIFTFLESLGKIIIFTLLYFTLLYFTLLYFTLLYFTLLYFTLLYFTLL